MLTMLKPTVVRDSAPIGWGVEWGDGRRVLTEDLLPMCSDFTRSPFRDTYPCCHLLPRIHTALPSSHSMTAWMHEVSGVMYYTCVMWHWQCLSSHKENKGVNGIKTGFRNIATKDFWIKETGAAGKPQLAFCASHRLQTKPFHPPFKANYLLPFAQMHDFHNLCGFWAWPQG